MAKKQKTEVPEFIEITLGEDEKNTQVQGIRLVHGQVVSTDQFEERRVRAMLKNRLARSTDKRPDAGQKKVADPKPAAKKKAASKAGDGDEGGDK